MRNRNCFPSPEAATNYLPAQKDAGTLRQILLIALCLFLPLNLAIAGGFDPKGAACSFDKFMTHLVRGEKTAPSLNSFFVAEKFEKTEGEFWIYWPQKRALLLIGWPAQDCKSPALLVRRRLDLTKDTVKSDADAGGSTYLVTEEWASKVIFAAAKDGYQVTIQK